MGRIIGGIVLGVAMVLGLTNRVTAQWQIFRPVSPQAYGRGGVYTHEGNDDPLAPLSNPAYLGFLAERNRFMSTFYADRTELGIWDPPIKISARALNIGFDHTAIQKFFDTRLPLSFGVGYQEAYTDLDETQQVDEYGHDIGTAVSYERSQGLGIGAAFHGKILQASAGLATRYYDFDMWQDKATYWGNDLGLILQLNLARAIDPHFVRFPVSNKRMQPFCFTSAGYSMLRLGGKYTWSGPEESSRRRLQDRTGRIFFNITGGLRLKHPVTDFFEVVSGGIAVEGYDVLLDRSLESYRNPIGDMHVFDDLILGHANDDIGKARGFELTVAEMFTIRSGVVEDLYLSFYTTSGYGVQLSGLLKLLCYDPSFNRNRVLRYAARHVDAQYNWSRHHEPHSTAGYYNGHSTYDNVTFEGIVLLWKP